MARRPAADERQADIFGAIQPTPVLPGPLPASTRKPRCRQGKDNPAPTPAMDGEDISAAAGVDALAAGLSPAELDELAAALPDDALAHLVTAVMRQLRRRLARTGARSGGKSRDSALERAARQVAAELGEADGSDYA